MVGGGSTPQGDQSSRGALGTHGRESQRHAQGRSQEEAMSARKPSCQKPRGVVKCSVMETRGASTSNQEEAAVGASGAAGQGWEWEARGHLSSGKASSFEFQQSDFSKLHGSWRMR